MSDQRVRVLLSGSTTRLRLVFCHNGTEHYDSLFVQRFASQFETFFVTFVEPTQDLEGAHVTKLKDFGAPLRFKRLNNLRIVLATLWRVFQMKRYFRLIRPDVVIGNWVTTYGLYASICQQRPFVLFAWGSDITIDPHRSFFHRYITQKVLDSADLVLIDSQVQKRAIIELGCTTDKIILFPWVNLDDLQHVIGDPSYRNLMDWKEKQIVVSVRKHEPVYAVDTLIKAIPSIVAHSPETRFLIFGKGTQTHRLKELTEGLKISGFVHFAGNIPRKELVRVMKDCDIYVSSSVSDGCSSSLLEAMSLGLPVVVASIPGNREWISDGTNGLLFEVHDYYGLARAILRLVTNHEEAKSLGQRAKDLVTDRVNWEGSTEGLIRRIYSIREIYT